MQVFIRGVPTIIHLDDIYPVTKYGRMIFSECNPQNDNCWGPVLEKLWSKINVNYERTCAGWQHEVIRVLLGVGAKDYLMATMTEDELWSALEKGNKQGHIMGCGSKGGGDHTKCLGNGLA